MPSGRSEALDVQSGQDSRRDRRFGQLIEKRDIVSGGATTSFIMRHIPGADGVVASRRGAGNDWVFEFGELRGNRFFTDQNGAFVQDLAYQPFGEATSTGTPPGSAAHTTYQWNGGDALAGFGLVHLGARVYDPVIGRFLSRDPLVVPRTASTTNPYAFAMNDPLNAADPSGFDCIGKECEPLAPLLLPLGFIGDLFGSGASAPPAQKAPPVSTGPQTREGRLVKRIMEENEGFTNREGLDWDNLAAMNLPYDDLVARIAATQGSYYPRHEGFNPVFNLVGSMGAGFGDSATLGGTSVLRNHVFGGAHSVDEESGGYFAGEALSFLVPWGRVTEAVTTGMRGLREARVLSKACVGRACLGGGCFVAGTLVATAVGPVPIETLKLGDRVDSGNPACAREHLPDDALSITLELPDPAQPGELIRVELARPRAWLAEYGLQERSGQAWLELDEVGVAGWAQVTHIGPPPREAPGQGCLVLMTVQRTASALLKLRLASGVEVEVTPRHPLFVDGRGWVAAGELKPGLLLRTDQGSVRIESIASAPANRSVFNVEVRDRARLPRLNGPHLGAQFIDVFATRLARFGGQSRLHRWHGALPHARRHRFPDCPGSRSLFARRTAAAARRARTQHRHSDRGQYLPWLQRGPRRTPGRRAGADPFDRQAAAMKT